MNETLKITQKRFLAGGQEIEVTGDDKVIVRSWGRDGRKEFTWALSDFDPNPSFTLKSSTRNLVFSIILSVAACVFFAICVYYQFVLKRPFAKEFLWPLCLSAMLSFVAFREYQRLSVDVASFEGPKGHFPVWRVLPDAETSRIFREKLCARIAAAKSQREGLYTESIANEIRGLSKLLSDGLITEREYKKGKARLLGLGDEAPDLLNGPDQSNWN